MKDSLEIPRTDDPPLNSEEISNLKKELEVKQTQKKPLKKNSNNNNTNSNEDIVNFKNTNSSYNNLMKKLRSSTPEMKKKFNFLNSFSKSSKNFFRTPNRQLNTDINDEELTPIQLRNLFQAQLGKLNDNSTKNIAYDKLKEIISNNATDKALRVYISALSSFDQNSSPSAKEIQVLLYGCLAETYKENFMDPIDKNPNIIKTINRVLGHIRNLYLKEDSYVVHKACSRSIIDIYDLCMPKDNIKSVNILFIEPLISLMSSGSGKSSKEGAAVCLADLIYHLGKDQSNEFNTKILSTLDDKVISLVGKSTMDNPYIFEALYNLMQFLPFETFNKSLKEIYDRALTILNRNNANKYNYLTKVNCLNILGLIAEKCKSVADISIGYYQKDIIKAIEFNTKDKMAKVQQAAINALNSWQELAIIHQDIENKKTVMTNNNISPSKDNFVINSKNENNGMVKKMDKFTYLRNLAKLAKIENKKIDYDTELPDKMREEVYKKGIGNILKLSNFLKNKNNNVKPSAAGNLLKSNNSFKKTNKDNKIRNEINEYLKYSEQVKKYDNSGNGRRGMDDLSEVGEVNENKEVSHKNPSNMGEKSSKKSPFNFAEEQPQYGTQFANNEENQPENNDEQDWIYNDENQSEERKSNSNKLQQKANQKHNQLPKLKQKSSQVEKIYINSNNPYNKAHSQIEEQSPHIDLTQIKSSLSDLITKTLTQSYTHFENQITSRLYDMENRITDIYKKLSDYQAHPNYKENLNQTLKTRKDNEDEEEIDYYINNQKNIQNYPQQSQTSQLDHEMIKNDLASDIRRELDKSRTVKAQDQDSQIAKLWKQALYQIEIDHVNEGYQMVLNSGDDIYLLRLVCITGPVFNKLSPEIGKRVLLRINMICRSHQIQSLLISLIRHSLKYNIFNTLNRDEQNDLLDSLYEFSGLNTKIGAEAAELYTMITK